MESFKARKVCMVTNPLKNICGVCGAPAANLSHYGSIACYSCRWSSEDSGYFSCFSCFRAFFRRSVGKDLFRCGRAAGACLIDEVTRTNCKICRFKACLQVGLYYTCLSSVCFLPSQIGMKPEKVGGNKKGKSNMSPTYSLTPHLKEAENRSEHLNQKEFNNRKTELIPQNPNLKLTLEEEFKIHEMDAMKESLLNMCQMSILGLLESGYFSLGTLILSETFPDEVKLETFNFSLTVYQICWGYGICLLYPG